MWLRFLTFCILVSLTLIIVASCIYGRPVIHLFFHRCCGEDIENDQVIFENFGNNFLKERLVGSDIIEDDNRTLTEGEEVERILDDARRVLSINDPQVKKWIKDSQESHTREDAITEDNIREQVFNKGTEGQYTGTGDSKYEILEEIEDTIDTESDKEYLNAHLHKRRF